MDRTILHCDLNNFYATAECVKNPDLKGKPLVVGGSVEDRHGIVLAKSTEAKKLGIKTGDKISEASCKFPDLIVLPPDFDFYLSISRKVRNIYYEYTDLVEPFGIDEAWLDVTGSAHVFGKGEKIANEIRERVKNETGLTVSVGVSFCKNFAKLGSDIKKPDAVTIISKENFKSEIWRMPVEVLLFAGRSTIKQLNKYGIFSVGEFAVTSPDFARKILGKNGYNLWLTANGIDNSPVAHMGEKTAVKSISRGITCIDNIISNKEAFRVIGELSSTVSSKLISEHLEAKSLRIIIKTNNLKSVMYSEHFIFPTNSDREISEKAFLLLQENYNWKKKIRSLTVCAFNLISSHNPYQIELNYNMHKRKKLDEEKLASLEIKSKYGKNAVFAAGRLQGTKMPSNKPEYSVLPTA